MVFQSSQCLSLTFHTNLWPLARGDVSFLGSRLALLLEKSLPVLGKLYEQIEELSINRELSSST